MAKKTKYEVDCENLKNEECATLIAAGVRYLNCSSYPSLDTFAKILGINVINGEEDAEW